MKTVWCVIYENGRTLPYKIFAAEQDARSFCDNLNYCWKCQWFKVEEWEVA